MLGTALSLLLAVFTALGKLLGIRANQQLIDAGKAEQSVEAEQKARAEVEAARRAEAEATRRHATDDTDAAFDPAFKRKD